MEVLLNKVFKGAGLFLPLSFFIFFFVVCSSFGVHDQLIENSEDKWHFVTLSEDGKYEIYVDQTSIKIPSQNEVYAIVKLYPSETERAKIKREFEELENQTQKEFGTKVEGTEKLLYEMYNLKSHYFQYKAKCNEKEIEVLGTGIIKFIIEVKPNTSSEKVYNYLCGFVKKTE